MATSVFMWLRRVVTVKMGPPLLCITVLSLIYAMTPIYWDSCTVIHGMASRQLYLTLHTSWFDRFLGDGNYDNTTQAADVFANTTNGYHVLWVVFPLRVLPPGSYQHERRDAILHGTNQCVRETSRRVWQNFDTTTLKCHALSLRERNVQHYHWYEAEFKRRAVLSNDIPCFMELSANFYVLRALGEHVQRVLRVPAEYTSTALRFAFYTMPQSYILTGDTHHYNASAKFAMAPQWNLLPSTAILWDYRVQLVVRQNIITFRVQCKPDYILHIWPCTDESCASRVSQNRVHVNPVSAEPWHALQQQQPNDTQTFNAIYSRHPTVPRPQGPDCLATDHGDTRKPTLPKEDKITVMDAGCASTIPAFTSLVYEVLTFFYACLVLWALKFLYDFLCVSYGTQAPLKHARYGTPHELDSMVDGILRPRQTLSLALERMANFSPAMIRECIYASWPNALFDPLPDQDNPGMTYYRLAKFPANPCVSPGCTVTERIPLDHHCRDCDQHVTFMDHHCYFLGRCIGAHNMTQFVALVKNARNLTLTVGVITMALLLVSGYMSASHLVIRDWVAHDGNVGRSFLYGGSFLFPFPFTTRQLSTMICSNIYPCNATAYAYLETPSWTRIFVQLAFPVLLNPTHAALSAVMIGCGIGLWIFDRRNQQLVRQGWLSKWRNRVPDLFQQDCADPMPLKQKQERDYIVDRIIAALKYR